MLGVILSFHTVQSFDWICHSCVKKRVNINSNRERTSRGRQLQEAGFTQRWEKEDVKGSVRHDAVMWHCGLIGRAICRNLVPFYVDTITVKYQFIRYSWEKKCNLQDCILLLLFNLLLLYLFKNKKVLEMPQDSNL